MAHAQKPDSVFQRNGRVHLNRRGCQFSRLQAVEVCGSADSNCIDRVPTYSARLLATHSIRIFPLHFLSRASPCVIRFRYQLKHYEGYTKAKGQLAARRYTCSNCRQVNTVYILSEKTANVRESVGMALHTCVHWRFISLAECMPQWTTIQYRMLYKTNLSQTLCGGSKGCLFTIGDGYFWKIS